MTNAKKTSVRIDASGVYYRDLNTRLRDVTCNGTRKIELRNVHGQRYIGTDLNEPVEIEIFGTPGNDLGAFMNGPKITVHGNAQDGCGNTMNDGEIVVHGHAGDTVGLSARGGKIFIREDVGYRAGIHMKEYQDKKSTLVIGGTAQDFVGELLIPGSAQNGGQKTAISAVVLRQNDIRAQCVHNFFCQRPAFKNFDLRIDLRFAINAQHRTGAARGRHIDTLYSAL